MARFNAVLFLVLFAFALMTSASMANVTSRTKASVAAPPTETPAAAPQASTPSEVAKTPSSASSPTAQAPASSHSAEGPGPALPPSNGATATASLEKVRAVIGASLIGGAAFLF